MRRTTVIAGALGAIMCLAGVGCDRAQQLIAPAVEQARQQTIADDLKAVGLAYHHYIDYNRQGPPGWDEFLAFADEENLNVGAIQRVRDAGYQLKWNVSFVDAAEGTMNFVLADSPAGGPTLMLDGSVR
jgi:hypothetical protein